MHVFAVNLPELVKLASPDIKITTGTVMTALKLHKTSPIDIVYTKNIPAGSILKIFFKAKLVYFSEGKKPSFLAKKADAVHQPIFSFDLSSYYKPAHYRPQIKNIAIMGGNKQIIQDLSQSLPEVNFSQNSTPGILINLKTDLGWGEPLLKAIASGVTVITVPIKGLEELLQDHQTCLIIKETSDPEGAPYRGFGLQTSDLVNHPEESYRLAKNAQMWLKQNLNTVLLPQIFAQQLRTLF